MNRSVSHEQAHNSCRPMLTVCILAEDSLSSTGCQGRIFVPAVLLICALLVCCLHRVYSNCSLVPGYLLGMLVTLLLLPTIEQGTRLVWHRLHKSRSFD